MSGHCCPPTAGPALHHAYVAKGTYIKLGDLEAYVTAPIAGSTKAIVVISDIFGYTQDCKQVLQMADIVSKQTCASVIVPDFFRGKPWSIKNFPPVKEEFMPWISALTLDKLRPDIDAAVAHVQAHGATSIGAVGFCWGASIAVALGADETFRAVGGAHPAFFGQDEALAEALKAPYILLPAGDDHIEKFVAAAKDKPYAAKSVFHQFKEQTHGFCAARGDWSDPAVAADASKALRMLIDFYDANL